MLYKGRIIKIGRRDAVVLSEGMFRRIHRKPEMTVSQEIFFTEEDLAVSGSRRAMFLATAALVLLFLGSLLVPGNPFLSTEPVLAAVISVDAGPGLEISVDKNLVVRDLRPLDEGAVALTGQGWTGRPLDEVLDLYLEAVRNAGHLDEDGGLLLGYSIVEEQNDDDLLSGKLEALLEQTASRIPRGLVLSVIPENARAAREQAISIGRYQLFAENLADESENQRVERLAEVRDTRVAELLARRDERLSNVPGVGPNRGEEISTPPDRSEDGMEEPTEGEEQQEGPPEEAPGRTEGQPEDVPGKRIRSRDSTD